MLGLTYTQVYFSPHVLSHSFFFLNSFYSLSHTLKSALRATIDSYLIPAMVFAGKFFISTMRESQISHKGQKAPAITLCYTDALHFSYELRHVDRDSLPFFLSPSCSFQNFPHFPALVSLVTLCCSLLECRDYASFYIRWLVPIVWKKRTTMREESQATGMPRQMAD